MVLKRPNKYRACNVLSKGKINLKVIILRFFLPRKKKMLVPQIAEIAKFYWAFHMNTRTLRGFLHDTGATFAPE